MFDRHEKRQDAGSCFHVSTKIPQKAQCQQLGHASLSVRNFLMSGADGKM
jgi:hypothetical protein